MLEYAPLGAEDYIQSQFDLFDTTPTPTTRRTKTAKEIRELHRALEPFVDLNVLRRVATEGLQELP
jgi:hypothetical protein